MKIQTITCSGPNEKVKTSDVLRLLIEYPMAEIGVQSSSGKASFGMPRYDWIKGLHKQSQGIKQKLRAALHVNVDWCQSFCDGIVAPELKEFLTFRHNDSPFFSRIQLNFQLKNGQTIADTADYKIVARSIKRYPEHKFILSLNERTEKLVHRIADENVDFDVLYDKSFGDGINPESWEAPAFPNRFQGYAGGLGPYNIKYNLDKISKVVPEDTDIFIDAESKLSDNDGIFLYEKAKIYIENALIWQNTR